MSTRRAGIGAAPAAIGTPVQATTASPDLSGVFADLAQSAKELRRAVQPALNEKAESDARADAFVGTGKPRKFAWTEQDRVYNQALKDAYFSQAAIDIEEGVTRAFAERDQDLDVETFDAEASKLRAGYLSSVPPEYAGPIGGEWDKQISRRRLQLAGARADREVRVAERGLRALQSQLINELSQADDITSPDVQASLSRFDAVTASLRDNPAYEYTEQEATIARDALFESIALNRVVNTAVSAYETEGFDAASKLLDEAEADDTIALKGARKKAVIGEARRKIRGLESERQREIREARRAAAIVTSNMRLEARQDLADTKAVLSAGGAVDVGAVQELAGRLQRLGLTAQASELVASARIRSEFGGLIVPQMQARVQELQVAAARGDAGAAMELNAARPILNEAATSTDPVNVYSSLRGAPVPQLAFQENGVIEPNSLRARLNFAEEAARDLGRPRTTYLDAGLKAELGSLLEGKPAAQQLATLSAIRLAAGSTQRAQAIFTEMGMGDNDGSLAIAGSLLAAGAGTTAAEMIIRGRSMRKTEGFKRVDFAPERRRRVLKDVVGASNLNDSFRATLSLAADDAFEAMVADGADATPQTYRRAVSMALGERKEGNRVFGGVDRGVIVPTWIARDQFRSVLNSLQPADFAAAGARGAPDGDISVARSADLFQVGDGRFRLKIDESADGTPVFLQDRSGRPYELDLNRIRQSLKERRSDAVR